MQKLLLPIFTQFFGKMGGLGVLYGGKLPPLRLFLRIRPMPTVRGRNPASITLHKTNIPTNRNNFHLPGMSTIPCGSRKKFPIHENKLLPRNVPFHVNPCKHFTTTHVVLLRLRQSLLRSITIDLSKKNCNVDVDSMSHSMWTDNFLISAN